MWAEVFKGSTKVAVLVNGRFIRVAPEFRPVLEREILVIRDRHIYERVPLSEALLVDQVEMLLDLGYALRFDSGGVIRPGRHDPPRPT